MRVRYSFSSRRTGKIDNIRKQRKPFPKVVEEVVEVSDIILEVLDARFALEMRNRALEKHVLSKGKKLVFVLNKSDLVDVDSVRSSLPKSMSPVLFVSSKVKGGGVLLRRKIMMEAKRVDIGSKRRVQVGIVGYPNTGKSSLINLLSRKGGTKTSKQAGFTKGLQKISLSKSVLLLDTPGVIPSSRYSSVSQDAFSVDALLGARTFSDVRDPDLVVAKLFSGRGGLLQSFYGVVASSSDEFLSLLGEKKGFLCKGGSVDLDRAARLVLKDWQRGVMKEKKES